MRYLRKHTINILLFILWLGMGLSLATARADESQQGDNNIESYSIDLTFTSYLEARLPEQDVFIERAPGSGEVYRVTFGDINMEAPLFKAAVPVPHNLFDAKAVGPHPKGAAFGMTLGEWLRHRGTGRYTCANGTGRLETRFTGLVENGIYTMWHSFTAQRATRPFSGFLELPLGARDGSTSVFVADENGAATFTHTFKPCLQMSDAWTTAMLAINYHSDGRTYAGLPGNFGFNVHVPLFCELPSRENFILN